MGDVLTYKQELTEIMSWLASKPDTIFIGQSVLWRGNSIFDTLTSVPEAKRLEFPVAEDFQLGFCVGLALAGYFPVSCYPRFDFLLLAANQLVNHLDRITEITGGNFNPRMIVRTMIGPKTPLNAGAQHTGDYTTAFRRMLRNVVVVKVLPGSVEKTYRWAYEEADKPVLIIEDGGWY